MLVCKFGGSSIAHHTCIASVKSIIEGKVRSTPVVCVVSAIDDCTDLLDFALRHAGDGDEGYTRETRALSEMHIEMTKALIGISLRSRVLSSVKVLLNELEEALKGISLIREYTPRSRDFVLSFGERLSSYILFEFLSQTFQDICLLDPTSFLVCNRDFGNGKVDIKQSMKRFSEVSLRRLNVMPGFIAGTEDYNIITLGRGGSDYTASLMARMVKANSLEIWTDVDGVMTADPRLVPRSRSIENLSYEEAMELSHFGAEVLFPPAIQTAMEADIEITVRNTFNPKFAGTRVGKKSGEENLICGISSISEMAIVSLAGSDMIGIPGNAFRMFRSISRERINVVMITQGSSEHAICAVVREEDKDRTAACINAEFQVEISQRRVKKALIEDHLCIAALVGNRMVGRIGVAAKMFSTLARNGISLRAISQGSSERNISIVVREQVLRKTLNCLHESFFTHNPKVMNLFVVGVGNVGSALLDQVHKQSQYLLEHYNVELRIVAMARSRVMIFDEQGINLAERKGLLKNGEPCSFPSFLQRMFELNLRNSVFLDLTASPEVSGVYADVMKKSISVVTANKIAMTGKFRKYQLLKELAREYKCRLLFETNVCAGLPIISTLGDLIKSGDRIRRIEAVLSGTLNYLFNTYDATRPFADIVKEAKDLGYSEPDPRLDLSGMDVVRKILVLVRESGKKAEIEDVHCKSFVSDKAMQSPSIEAFFEAIKSDESHFRSLVESSTRENKKIRYMATFDGKRIETGLKFLDSREAAYNLEGSDNIVLFYTDRYKKEPMAIKGAGAGAEVTAAGVFGDIMKVASAGELGYRE